MSHTSPDSTIGIRPFGVKAVTPSSVPELDFSSVLGDLFGRSRGELSFERFEESLLLEKSNGSPELLLEGRPFVFREFLEPVIGNGIDTYRFGHGYILVY